MGHSISKTTADRLDANRAAGRTCQGSGRCSTRATQAILSMGWNYKVGEGAEHLSLLFMCAKHAKQAWEWDGCGVNFVNIDQFPLRSTATKDDLDAMRAKAVAWQYIQADVDAYIARWQRSGVAEARR